MCSLGESEVTVSWDVPAGAAGQYRLGHRGYHHTIIRGNFYYEGWSEPFLVSAEAGQAASPVRSAATLSRPWSFLADWWFGLSM